MGISSVADVMVTVVKWLASVSYAISMLSHESFHFKPCLLVDMICPLMNPETLKQKVLTIYSVFAKACRRQSLVIAADHFEKQTTF